MQRRQVFVTDDLYANLDSHLGDERGPNGEPSRFDFLRFDLIEIIDQIAVEFDDLPEAIPGHPYYRLLVIEGRMVDQIAVVGHLAPDGSIELVHLDLNFD